jgi:hypothetical protein
MLVSSVLFRSFLIGVGVLVLASFSFVGLQQPIYKLLHLFLDMPRLGSGSV